MNAPGKTMGTGRGVVYIPLQYVLRQTAPHRLLHVYSLPRTTFPLRRTAAQTRTRCLGLFFSVQSCRLCSLCIYVYVVSSSSRPWQGLLLLCCSLRLWNKVSPVATPVYHNGQHRRRKMEGSSGVYVYAPCREVAGGGTPLLVFEGKKKTKMATAVP